ncbi:hypothetical protein ACNKHO_25590 [Shigella flexneri]
MPHDVNGTPVEIVLNPLAYRSYGICQILETHLGTAAKGIGDKINAMPNSSRKSRNCASSSSAPTIWGRRSSESPTEHLQR